MPRKRLWIGETVAGLLSASLVLLPLLRIQVEHYQRPATQSAKDHADKLVPDDAPGLISIGLTTVQTLAIVLQAALLNRQRRIMQDQAGIAEKQTALQRSMHISANRPKLVVRAVQVARGFEGKGEAEEPVPIQFEIVNVGGTEAQVTRTGFTSARVIPDLGHMSIEDLRLDAPAEIFLAGGESRRYRLSLSLTRADMTKIELLPERDGGARWMAIFTGGIVYEDELGVQRRTFCRRVLNFKTMCFMPGDDPEYEYAD